MLNGIGQSCALTPITIFHPLRPHCGPSSLRTSQPMLPFLPGTNWQGFGLLDVNQCCYDCFIASLCFSNALLFTAFVPSSGLLGQSPDTRRCQLSLHPASISLNWGISAARMLRMAASSQGKKVQEPLCLRLASPGTPIGVQRDGRILE